MKFAFITLIVIRWFFQILCTTKHKTEPQDIITALLFLAYTILLTLAITLGTASISTLILLGIAITLRTLAIYQLREHFSYPCKPTELETIVSSGIYSWHKNPLLLGFWLELSVFIMMLPLIFSAQCMLIIACGLLCAWHAHVDNNYLLLISKTYSQYWQKTSNLGLNWLLPERAYLLDYGYFSISMVGLYLFLGCYLGLLFASGSGLLFLPTTLLLIIATLCNTLIQRFSDLSFYGGLLTGGIILFFYCYFWQWPLFSFNTAITSFALAHAVSHLGHIAQGCCYGIQHQNYQLYDLIYRDPQQTVNLSTQKNASIVAPSIIIEGVALCALAFLCAIFSANALVIWLIGYGALSILMQGLKQEPNHHLKNLVSLAFVISGLLLAQYRGWSNFHPIAFQWVTPSWQTWLQTFIVALIFASTQGLKLKSKKVSIN